MYAHLSLTISAYEKSVTRGHVADEFEALSVEHAAAHQLDGILSCSKHYRAALAPASHTVR